ncbi:hypothetical protein EGM51_10760 [Verrucomicrobia bacterium S94]|nr:hypothetical protein EGM51_10760 [Verrucomicrobia bacterium S94]
MPISRGQQGKYRTLVDAAYMAEAQRLRGEIPRKDEWRRQLNVRTTGKYSTKQMNSTTDFDAVMLELAIIADDYYWINRLSTAAERRLRHIIEWFIYDLEYLTKQTITWKYIQGICKQAGYADSLMDCPAEHLAKVMQMTDTHVRRLANKVDIARSDLPSAYMRKGLSDAEAIARFRHDHHHHINHRSAA